MKSQWQRLTVRDRWFLGGGLVLLLVVMLLRLSIGETCIGWPGLEIATWRAQRLVVGLLIGIGLSLAGVQLQALLRNPLASPFILGTSSGAAFGVMLFMYLQRVLAGSLLAAAPVVMEISWQKRLLTDMGMNTAAVAGALLTLAVVYLLGRKRGRIDPLGLLLVGVMVNAINGAGVMALQYLAPHGLRGDFALWMTGYFNINLQWPTIGWVVLVMLPVLVSGLKLSRSLDAATFSDTEAHAMGVNMSRLRPAAFCIAGLLTAGTVMLAGPIGFVGLISPHLVRMVVGPRHWPLQLGSMLIGAVLVIGADTLVTLAGMLASAMGRPIGSMPLGVIMSLVGGPVFLWMLRSQMGRGVAA